MNFTLTVPSWVVPDTWAGNLRFVADKPYIQGMELLLYLWDGAIRRDFLAELPEIRSYSDRLHLSLHLPEADASTIGDIVANTASFVKSYCVHPPKNSEDLEAFAIKLLELRTGYGDVFFLENTKYAHFKNAYDFLATKMPDKTWPVCMDTAHLLQEDQSIAWFIANYGHAIREIHLNDSVDGKDHVALSRSSTWMADCVPLLRSFSGLLELELFSIQAVEASLEALAYFLHEGA